MDGRCRLAICGRTALWFVHSALAPLAHRREPLDARLSHHVSALRRDAGVGQPPSTRNDAWLGQIGDEGFGFRNRATLPPVADGADRQRLPLVVRGWTATRTLKVPVFVVPTSKPVPLYHDSGRHVLSIIDQLASRVC